MPKAWYSAPMISEYVPILVFLAIAVGLAAVMIVVSVLALISKHIRTES